jgi:tripartite ATP-independent transporter DctM subunit
MTDAMAEHASGEARAPGLLAPLEDGLAVAAFLGMGILPVLELALRSAFGVGVPGSFGYVQHLTLWVAFLGAMIASREQRHIMLFHGLSVLPERYRRPSRAVVSGISAAVATGLCWASVAFVLSETESGTRLGGWLPVWVAETILPIAFGAIGLRFVQQAGDWSARAVAIAIVLIAGAGGLLLSDYGASLVWPAIITLIAAAVFGAPIFVVIGGAALILFFADQVPVAAIPVETYRIVVSPLIPAIPLFTLTGYLLAEGQSSRRLLRLFRAVFGWMPGGLVIATTLVCAFFSTFTGASGVTILALGGLLLPVLTGAGLSERFAMGLVTSTGSIGLLFPPSLAVILYGVVARVPIGDLYVAAFIPGLIMVAAVSLYGLREGLRSTVPRPPFSPREIAAAVMEAKWEIFLPAVALFAIFGGFTSLIEAAALTVVYALLMQTAIHRDISLSALPAVIVRSTAVIGGVFAILGVAMGLTNYLVDAMVPMQAADWVRTYVQSPLVFLLVLNVFLLIVGCLMDIFSAIIVVVPLIQPISQSFGIDPLHLGVIFLVNLELGYLHPPVGMNLLLAALRFDRPVLTIFWGVLPFFAALLAVVLLVTYVPGLTVAMP